MRTGKLLGNQRFPVIVFILHVRLELKYNTVIFSFLEEKVDAKICKMFVRSNLVRGKAILYVVVKLIHYG